MERVATSPMAIPGAGSPSKKKKKKNGKKKRGGVSLSADNSPFTSPTASPTSRRTIPTPLALSSPSSSPSTSATHTHPLSRLANSALSRSTSDLEWARDINWRELEDEKGGKRGKGKEYFAGRKQLDTIINESQGGSGAGGEKKKKKKGKKGTANEDKQEEEEAEVVEEEQQEEEGRSPQPAKKVITRYKMDENPNWAFVIDDSVGDEDSADNVRVRAAPAPTHELPVRTHSRKGSVESPYNSDSGGGKKKRQGSGLKDDTTQEVVRTHSRSSSADASPYNSDGGGSGISRRKAGGSALKNEQRNDATQDAAQAVKTQDARTQDATPPASPGSPATRRRKGRRDKKGRKIRGSGGDGVGFSIDDSVDENSTDNDDESEVPAKGKRVRNLRSEAGESSSVDPDTDPEA